MLHDQSPDSSDTFFEFWCKKIGENRSYPRAADHLEALLSDVIAHVVWKAAINEEIIRYLTGPRRCALPLKMQIPDEREMLRLLQCFLQMLALKCLLKMPIGSSFPMNKYSNGHISIVKNDEEIIVFDEQTMRKIAQRLKEQISLCKSDLFFSWSGQRKSVNSATNNHQVLQNIVQRLSSYDVVSFFNFPSKFEFRSLPSPPADEVIHTDWEEQEQAKISVVKKSDVPFAVENGPVQQQEQAVQITESSKEYLLHSDEKLIAINEIKPLSTTDVDGKKTSANDYEIKENGQVEEESNMSDGQYLAFNSSDDMEVVSTNPQKLNHDEHQVKIEKSSLATNDKRKKSKKKAKDGKKGKTKKITRKTEFALKNNNNGKDKSETEKVVTQKGVQMKSGIIKTHIHCYQTMFRNGIQFEDVSTKVFGTGDSCVYNH